MDLLACSAYQPIQTTGHNLKLTNQWNSFSKSPSIQYLIVESNLYFARKTSWNIEKSQLLQLLIALLPLQVNQDSNCDVEEKCQDIWKWTVVIQYSGFDWQLDEKKKQLLLKKDEFDACQDQQHFLAYLVHQDSTARMKIYESCLEIPTRIRSFRLRHWRKKQVNVLEKNEFENRDEYFTWRNLKLYTPTTPI